MMSDTRTREQDLAEELAARRLIGALVSEARYQGCMSRALLAMGPRVVAILGELVTASRALRAGTALLDEWEGRK
jgi:hypothetical protein